MAERDEGRVLAGKYRLLDLIGRGGMGAVWRADHLILEARVAIKLLRDEIALHPRAMARFVEEAKAAAKLRSPHVVQILDYGVDDDLAFICMELLEGESLGERLARSGPLAPSDVARVVRHVTRALSKAHAAGILHRDLKPDNIFLVEVDDEWLAKVLDFGIAKRTQADDRPLETGPGVAVGTPAYMSREQLVGADVDHRCDIWALGVVVYQCLCGRLPHQPRAVSRGQDERPPLGLAEGFSPAMEDFFQQALAIDPSARFASARDLQHRFEDVVADLHDPDLPRRAEAFADTMMRDPEAVRASPAAPPSWKTPTRKTPSWKTPSAPVASQSAGPQSDPADGDADHRLQEVALEQRFHLRNFVGRADVLGEVDDWLESDDEGGYLLITGGPGQGKSALMAALAARHPDALVHMVKSHRGPSRFVPALISQVARTIGVSFGREAYLGADDDQRQTLLRALGALVAERGRALVIIDGLDELEPDAGLDFLPAMLPPNVRFVLSSRPEQRLLDALRRRASNLEVRALSPLSPDDAAALLEHCAGDMAALPLSEIVERAHGSPLLLRRCADQVSRWRRRQAAGAFDLEQLPRAHAELFAQIHREIATPEPGDSADGQERLVVLHLLCVAREAIDPGTLAAVLGEPTARARCRRHFESMSGYLIDRGDNRVEPWHQGLVDHVRDVELGDAGVREFERMFATWARDSDDAYAIAHAVDHLLAAGDVEGAATRALSPAYLQRRVDAGGVHALITELDRVAARDPECRQGPALVARMLRRHGHLLVRHPEALFGALYNSGIWHEQTVGHDERDAPAHRLGTWLKAWRASRPARPWVIAMRPERHRLDDTAPTLFRGHDGNVDGVAWSPLGHPIASVGSDGTFRLWDPSTAECLAVRRATARGRARACAVSQDGQHFVSGGDDGTRRMWSRDGASIESVAVHSAPITAIATAANGAVATGGQDRRVVLSRAGRQDVVFDVAGPVLDLALSVDGARLAVAVGPARLVLYDLSTASACATVELDYSVMALCFVADGGLLAVFGNGRLCTLDADGVVLETRDVDERRLWALALSPDQHSAVCAGSSGRINAVSLAAGAIEVTSVGHRDGIDDLCFSPDGERLLSASRDGTARSWRVNTPERAALADNGARIASAAYRHDGRRLAVGGYDGSLRLWDSERGLATTHWSAHDGAVLALAYRPDGSLLASGASDCRARVHKPNGEHVLTLSSHESAVTALAWTPDGSVLVTASLDHTVRGHSLFGGRQLWRVALNASARALHVSADGAVFRVLDRHGDPSYLGPDGSPARAEDFVAAPAPRFEAVARSGETAVLERGRPIAFYPAALDPIVASPSGLQWAGWQDAHLHLFALEDAP
jgi:eukaryotic-like serine/threonine-protein kinase